MDDKGFNARMVFGFALAFIVVAVGIMLNQLKIGVDEYLGFATLGNWLMYIGLVMLFVNLLRAISKKDRLVDERMEYIGSQASRIVFIALIVVAFVIMVADGIEPIDIPLGMFMAYLINAMLLIYFISYKVMLKYG